jgi:hypothetical protein
MRETTDKITRTLKYKSTNSETMPSRNFIGLYFMWFPLLSSNLLLLEGKKNTVKFNIPTGSTVRKYNFLPPR